MRGRFGTNVKFAGNLKAVTGFVLPTYNFFDWILITSFLVFYVLQLYFIFRFFLKTFFLKVPSESIFDNHISIIIPVRNEEEKIETIVSELLDQQYTNFELIVVDDHSIDRTDELLFNLTRKYKNVKYTGITQDVRFSEKMNINLGIKASKSEWVIFTDSQVKQRDKQWLKKMNQYINNEVDAVVGYSNVKRGKGFVRFLFRLEKLWQFIQGAAFTLGGVTFFTDQDNVLIRKKVYYDKGGFREHINKNYANLEFILNQQLDSRRVRIATGEIALFSDTNDRDDFSYKNLVKKSMQIRKSLSVLNRFYLLADEYSRLLLTGVFIAVLIVRPFYWEFLVGIFLVYFIFLLLTWWANQRRLKEQKLFLSSLVYILIRPLVTIIIEIAKIIKDRRNRWN